METKQKFVVLFEDEQLCVCKKPPGLPCESAKMSQPDLVKLLKKRYFLKDPEQREPYIGLVHRLDQPVGGIMVLARTPRAAEGLSRQIRERRFVKQYLAVVTPEKEPEECSGHFKDYLKKEGTANRSRIADKEERQAKLAEMDYEIIGQQIYQERKLMLVKVTLGTGRHHQIRAQLSFHGMPLMFDRKYRPSSYGEQELRNAALFAYHLEFAHPETGKVMEFTQYPEAFPFSLFPFP